MCLCEENLTNHLMGTEPHTRDMSEQLNFTLHDSKISSQDAVEKARDPRALDNFNKRKANMLLSNYQVDEVVQALKFLISRC